MNLTIQTDGLCLPVSDKLIHLLQDKSKHLDITQQVQALNFVFQSPGFSETDGGFLPVEIRLERQGEYFTITGMTHYSYIKHRDSQEGWSTKDFDFLFGQCAMLQILPDSESSETDQYRLFEKTVIEYVEMDVLRTSIEVIYDV